MKRRGVTALLHYLQLHVSAMGRSFGGRPGDCPVTENVSDRLLRLPLFNDMTDAEQRHLIESVTAFVAAASASRL